MSASEVLLRKKRQAYLVVGRREWSFQLQLYSAAKRSQNGLQLDVGELENGHVRAVDKGRKGTTNRFTNASVTTGTEWLIRRLGTLRDTAVSIVDLVTLGVLFRCLRCYSGGVIPSMRVPVGGV